MSIKKKSIFIFAMCFVLLFSNMNVKANKIDASKIPTGDGSKYYMTYTLDFRKGESLYYEEYLVKPCISEGDICLYYNHYGDEYLPLSTGILNGDNYFNSYQNVTRVYDNESQILDDGSNSTTSSLSLYLRYVENLVTNMYVFSDYNSAKLYLETGELTNVLMEPTELKEYISDEIYLDNFVVEVHDSNEFDNYYLDIKYTLPEYLEEHIDNAVLNLSFSYERSISGIGGLVSKDYDTSYSEKIYNLSTYPSGFRLYIKDIECILEHIYDGSPGEDVYDGLLKRQVLGTEFAVDFSDFSIDGFGAETLAKIDKSKLYIKLVPSIENSYGCVYDASVDFLSGMGDYYSSYADSDGNYTMDNYYQNDGYYYTEVGQDSHGNNTYNYYYITDNSKTEIDGDSGGSSGSSGDGVNVEQNNNVSIPDEITVNLNGYWSGSGGSGDNITIEDDDYSPDALKNVIDGAYGVFDNLSTEKNDDGFLALLSGFLGALNPDLGGMISFGMGSVIVISILRSLINR